VAVKTKILLMNSSRKRIPLYPTEVLSNSTLKEGVHYLKIEKRFSFLPGQVIAVALNQEDEPRLYSIASGSKDNYLGILFDIYPEGQLTPLMSLLKPGDQLYISEPFGKFLCEKTPAMWIATGTGVAPFFSLAKSGKANHILLLHGSRTIDAFFFQDFFNDTLCENYIRFCTTEEAKGIHSGRLTQYLHDRKELPTNYKYYLCGSSQMVIDVREILIEKGIPYDHIIAEIYF